MRRDEGYWSAVALVGFANLPITRATWRSLWGAWGWPSSPPLRTPARRRWDARMVGLARTGRVDELQRAYRTELRRYGDEGRRASLDPADWVRGLPETPVDLEGRVALIDRSGDLFIDPPTTRRVGVVLAVHQAAGDRLATIIAGKPQALYSLCTALIRVPLGTGLAVIRHVGSDGLQAEPPADETESLAAWVDGLFLRAARAGFWPRFFTCATCGRFTVGRLRRARFCSSRCRARAHRKQHPRSQPGAAIRAAVETLRRQGVRADTAVARVARQFGFPEAAVWQLTARHS